MTSISQGDSEDDFQIPIRPSGVKKKVRLTAGTYNCTICRKTVNEEDRQEHKRGHEVVCIYCGVTSKSKSNLKVHMKKVHGV